MKAYNLALVALGPLFVHALPKAHRQCGQPPAASSGVAAASASTVPTSTSVAPVLTNTPSGGYATSTYASSAAETATSAPASDDTTPSSVLEPSTSSTASLATDTVTGTTATIPTAATTADTAGETAASISAYAQATPLSFKVPATQQCGDDDHLTLPGMPWTVANSMYNADQMVGSQCTNFEGILETTDGTREVQWNSVTDIELVEDTKDLCKGYTNIGIGVNLNNQLSAITSIPAYFKWDRTNTTEFRGSNLFDFITAPTAHDGTSTATSEFMLWIRIWGGQVPIGYADGPVATLDLFGASWKLYEGQNPASGVTVRSMLVDEDFESEFQGDLKEWLDVMVQKGYISDSDYLTVGNAGTEVFYGSAVMNATVALNIEL